MHPTVIVRGYVKALEDAIKIIDDLSFPVDVHDREQMLKLVNSCIGTKFTNQFGDLMAVSGVWQQLLSAGLPRVCWSACRQKGAGSQLQALAPYLLSGSIMMVRGAQAGAACQSADPCSHHWRRLTSRRWLSTLVRLRQGTSTACAQAVEGWLYFGLQGCL